MTASIIARANALGAELVQQNGKTYFRTKSGDIQYIPVSSTVLVPSFRFGPLSPMYVYEDDMSIVVTFHGFIGELIRAMDGEIQLAIYKEGFKDEACEQMAEPGKLRKDLRCPNLSILFTLFNIARVKWAGLPCHFEAVDDHRINGYKRLLKRAGLTTMHIPSPDEDFLDSYLIMPASWA